MHISRHLILLFGLAQLNKAAGSRARQHTNKHKGWRGRWNIWKPFDISRGGGGRSTPAFRHWLLLSYIDPFDLNNELFSFSLAFYFSPTARKAAYTGLTPCGHPVQLTTPVHTRHRDRGGIGSKVHCCSNVPWSRSWPSANNYPGHYILCAFGASMWQWCCSVYLKTTV